MIEEHEIDKWYIHWIFPGPCKLKWSHGLMSVSEKLHTYPSPNPTSTLTFYQLTVAGLARGGVGEQLLKYWSNLTGKR